MLVTGQSGGLKFKPLPRVGYLLNTNRGESSHFLEPKQFRAVAQSQPFSY